MCGPPLADAVSPVGADTGEVASRPPPAQRAEHVRRAPVQGGSTRIIRPGLRSRRFGQPLISPRGSGNPEPASAPRAAGRRRPRHARVAGGVARPRPLAHPRCTRASTHGLGMSGHRREAMNRARSPSSVIPARSIAAQRRCAVTQRSWARRAARASGSSRRTCSSRTRSPGDSAGTGQDLVEQGSEAEGGGVPAEVRQDRRPGIACAIRTQSRPWRPSRLPSVNSSLASRRSSAVVTQMLPSPGSSIRRRRSKALVPQPSGSRRMRSALPTASTWMTLPSHLPGARTRSFTR